jgi:hypothetical protein
MTAIVSSFGAARYSRTRTVHLNFNLLASEPAVFATAGTVVVSLANSQVHGRSLRPPQSNPLGGGRLARKPVGCSYYIRARIFATMTKAKFGH